MSSGFLFNTLIYDVKLLQLIYKKLNEIKQYENNPRKNDDAVKYVAEFAEWDLNILNLELYELIDFDMSSFGFDIDEVVDEYGTDFDLPNGDKSELEQITFTLHHEQAEFIKYSIRQIDENSEINSINESYK